MAENDFTDPDGMIDGSMFDDSQRAIFRIEVPAFLGMPTNVMGGVLHNISHFLSSDKHEIVIDETHVGWEMVISNEETSEIIPFDVSIMLPSDMTMANPWPGHEELVRHATIQTMHKVRDLLLVNQADEALRVVTDLVENGVPAGMQEE